ncbi:MAG: glycine cleavage system protein GcvH [Lentisphaeria bacterium]|nr:glycine cleavage system protein GcvH [Lentisphaeria bacterium]
MAKYYAESHEWIELDGTTATLGISRYAADSLGDITYVEIPVPGKTVAAGEVLCTVESVKAVSDVYAPVAGTVGEGNSDLEADPGAINADPENTWICKLEGVNADDLGSLMDADAYAKFVETL